MHVALKQIPLGRLPPFGSGGQYRGCVPDVILVQLTARCSDRSLNTVATNAFDPRTERQIHLRFHEATEYC